MADIRTTTTNYVHPTDPNLLNIHKAMKFNNDGEPVVRTHVDGISLQGDVIVDTVSLSSATLAALESINVQNTVSVTVSNFPAYPTSSTVYQGTNPWVVTGTIAVANPTTAVTATIVGDVTVGSLPDASISSFEEPLAIPVTPVIQSNAKYGQLDPDFWDTTIVNGGTITVDDTNVWRCTITTATNSYARLFTTRYLTYHPGQGAMFRWTAAFTCNGTGTTATGIVSIPQVAGPIDQEDGYAFGFNGNSLFGIQHRRNGKIEIRKLVINTPPGGAQTVTIVLNGVTYTAPVTLATTASYTVSQIKNYLMTATDITNYWNLDACSGAITFAAMTPGPKNGTYSFSSSGAGTISTGSFTQVVAGSSPSDTWTYINNWNGNPISGFDPSKLNVYGLDMRWLGAGIVRFFIENPATGKMTVVHTQKWTSTQLYPHINKPNLRLSYRIGSNSGAASPQAATLYGASIFAGIQGTINQTGRSQGAYNIDSSTRAKDVVYHLITVQNPYTQQSGLNKDQLLIQDMTVAAQGNDPSVIYVVKNAVGFSDHLVFNNLPGQNNSVVFAQVSTSAVTEDLSKDNVANVQTLGINSSAQFDLMKYNLYLAPGETFSVFISSSNAINRTSVGVTWRVD